MATVGTVIIDVKADTAKLVSGMDRAEKSVKKSVENIKQSLVTMASAYLGFQGASKAYDLVIKSGLAYNMQLEESKAGLVALSVAVQNNTIPIMTRYAKANKDATATLTELQKINASTPHTLDQTNQIYKAMYVSMKKAGASTSDLITLTKQISIAAGAGGIEFNNLLAGVDGLATGTVLANSDLGRFLSSLGLTNKALKESKDVVKLLEDKLKSFKAPDTMQVAMSNLKTQWEQLTGELTKPLFDTAKQDIKDFTKVLNDNKSDLLEFGLDVGRTGQLVANGYKAIYQSSTLGYLELAYTFKTEIGNILNYITDTMVETNNYWADTWLGKKAGLQKIKIDDFIIDGKALKKQIDSTKVSLAGLGVENDKLLKDIINNTQAQKNSVKEIETSLDRKSKKTKEISDKEKKQAKELYNAKIKAYSKYIQIVGTEEEKFQDKLAQQMSALGESGQLTANQLLNAFNKLNSDHQISLTITGLDDAQNSMTSMLDSQIALAESGMNWGNSLTGVAKQIANVSKATTKLYVDKLKYEKADATLQAKYAKKYLAASGNEIKQKKIMKEFDVEHSKLKEAQFSAEMAGWSNLAGTMSGAFKQGSDGAIAMAAVQSALGIASSWTAIAEAWALPFPMNLAAVPIVAAGVMPIIQQLGGSGGGAGGSVPAIGVKDTNYNGSGSVYGDSSKISESIANSVKITADYAKPQYDAILNLNNSLQKLTASLDGVVNHAIGNSNFSNINYSTKNKDLGKFGGTIATTVLTGIVGLTLDFLSGGKITKGINNVVGKVFGGKKTVSTSDYGASFNKQNINDVVNSNILNGNQYDVIHTHKSGGWFSGSKDSYDTRYSDLNSEFKKDMGEVIASVDKSVTTATKALGISVSSVENDLSNFVIDPIKVSFNQSSDDIQKQLNGEISKLSDKLSKTLVHGLLDPYRQAGEGMFETLTRVATDTQVVTKNLGLLGRVLNNISKINGTYLENQAVKISESFVNIAGSLNEFNSVTGSYYDNYYSGMEKLAKVKELLSKNFNDLGVTMPVTAKGFRNLVNSIDITTESGRKLYYNLLQLSDSFKTVADASAKSIENIKTWNDSFKSQDQLVADMASKFGLQVAHTADGLQKLFNNLKDGLGGLTDSELKFLQANKSLIDSIRQAKQSTLTGIQGSRGRISENIRVLSGKRYTKDDITSGVFKLNNMNTDQQANQVTLVEKMMNEYYTDQKALLKKQYDAMVTSNKIAQDNARKSAQAQNDSINAWNSINGSIKGLKDFAYNYRVSANPQLANDAFYQDFSLLKSAISSNNSDLVSSLSSKVQGDASTYLGSLSTSALSPNDRHQANKILASLESLPKREDKTLVDVYASVNRVTSSIGSFEDVFSSELTRLKEEQINLYTSMDTTLQHSETSIVGEIAKLTTEVSSLKAELATIARNTAQTASSTSATAHNTQKSLLEVA